MQCHLLLQADEEDRVRSADGDRGGQGHAASQPGSHWGLPHGTPTDPASAAAPAQHTRRWLQPGAYPLMIFIIE